jgi:hypothetical protein
LDTPCFTRTCGGGGGATTAAASVAILIAISDVRSGRRLAGESRSADVDRGFGTNNGGWIMGVICGVLVSTEFLLEDFPVKARGTDVDLRRGAPLPPASSRFTDDAATAASNKLDKLLAEST